jgi:predicted small lipoprotein YifL
MSRMLLGLAALTLVSACGIKGDLARPDPMWNHDEVIRRECQHQVENNQRVDPRCSRYQTGVQTPSTAPATTTPPAQTTP